MNRSKRSERNRQRFLATPEGIVSQPVIGVTFSHLVSFDLRERRWGGVIDYQDSLKHVLCRSILDFPVSYGRETRHCAPSAMRLLMEQWFRLTLTTLRQSRGGWLLPEP